jgi:hypothetical protein
LPPAPPTYEHELDESNSGQLIGDSNISSGLDIVRKTLSPQENVTQQIEGAFSERAGNTDDSSGQLSHHRVQRCGLAAASTQ